MPIGSGSETANGLHWYAVWSRSRHEKMVAGALSNAGITNFLPLVTETHRWSDRRKSVDVPLFPGYVFVQIPNSAEAQLRVRKMSGVVQFVGNQQGAVPIRDKEINDVKAVLEQRVSYSPYPFLQVGQRVRICGGAFDGIEGVLVGRDSASKLVISIELIQRSLAVSVYNLDVEPIGGYVGSLQSN
ncbi:MAG: UpxY family transcription antiterminator [Candidatus Sulfotelmatobacter sp.]